jgi:hypothetical protein
MAAEIVGPGSAMAQRVYLRCSPFVNRLLSDGSYLLINAGRFVYYAWCVHQVRLESRGSVLSSCFYIKAGGIICTFLVFCQALFAVFCQSMPFFALLDMIEDYGCFGSYQVKQCRKLSLCNDLHILKSLYNQSGTRYALSGCNQ